jgi:hypothetical protein
VYSTRANGVRLLEKGYGLVAFFKESDPVGPTTATAAEVV